MLHDMQLPRKLDSNLQWCMSGRDRCPPFYDEAHKHTHLGRPELPVSAGGRKKEEGAVPITANSGL